MSASELPLPTPEVSSDRVSHSQVRTLALMVMTVGGLYLCYRMALPFVPALAWALALALLLVPVQRWLESKLHSPGLAAGILVLLAGLVVVFPAMLIGDRMIAEASSGAKAIAATVESGEWRANLQAYPMLAIAADWVGRQFDLPDTINAITSRLTGTVASLARQSVLQIIGMVLTLYMLLFFCAIAAASLRSSRRCRRYPEPTPLACLAMSTTRCMQPCTARWLSHWCRGLWED